MNANSGNRHQKYATSSNHKRAMKLKREKMTKPKRKPSILFPQQQPAVRFYFFWRFFFTHEKILRPGSSFWLVIERARDGNTV